MSANHADQIILSYVAKIKALCGYRAADLHLCFQICKNHDHAAAHYVNCFQLAMASFYEGDPDDDDDLSPSMSVQGQGIPAPVIQDPPPPGGGEAPTSGASGAGASGRGQKPAKPSSR